MDVAWEMVTEVTAEDLSYRVTIDADVLTFRGFDTDEITIIDLAAFDAFAAALALYRQTVATPLDQSPPC